MSNKAAMIKAQAEATLARYAGGNTADYSLVKRGRGTYYGYDGSMDEFVNFDGNQAVPAFTDEINTHRTYDLSFDSTNDNADREFIIFPGIYPTAGVLLATDGAVTTPGSHSVTFTGSPQPLAQLQAFTKYFPSRVVGMKLNSSNQLQHGVSMKVIPLNPWRYQTEVRTINFELHTNEYKQQLTYSTIKEGFQADPKTEVRFTVKANTTGKLSFFFGAVMDTSEALRAKATAAGASN